MADPEAVGLEGLELLIQQEEATRGSLGDSGWPVQEKRAEEAFGNHGSSPAFPGVLSAKFFNHWDWKSQQFVTRVLKMSPLLQSQGTKEEKR